MIPDYSVKIIMPLLVIKNSHARIESPSPAHYSTDPQKMQQSSFFLGKWK